MSSRSGEVVCQLLAYTLFTSLTYLLYAYLYARGRRSIIAEIIDILQAKYSLFDNRLKRRNNERTENYLWRPILIVDVRPMHQLYTVKQKTGH